MKLLSKSNIIIAILTLTVIILCFAKCEKPTLVQPDIKNKISEQKQDKDSIRERIVYKDRVRIQYVEKYRKFKHDSMPCPEALNEVLVLTDSIIVVDSSLIASLKAELFVDSLIIKNQGDLITQDSIKIVSFNKEVKKQTRRKKVWQAISLALGVTVLVK